MKISRLRLYGDTQSVLLFIVSEAAPRSGVLGKDDSPFFFAGEHVQAIGSLRQWLALDGDRISERDGCVLVGAGTPNLSVGDQAAPDFPAIHQRTMVVERDVGDANSLRHNRVLAWAWQIKNGRLRMSKRNEHEYGLEQQQNTSKVFVHGRKPPNLSCLLICPELRTQIKRTFRRGLKPPVSTAEIVLLTIRNQLCLSPRESENVGNLLSPANVLNNRCYCGFETTRSYTPFPAVSPAAGVN